MKLRKKAARCPHNPDIWEGCSDGTFCPLCIEGVCPDCRRLWLETGDSDLGPACRCGQPVVLPYSPT